MKLMYESQKTHIWVFAQPVYDDSYSSYVSHMLTLIIYTCVTTFRYIVLLMFTWINLKYRRILASVIQIQINKCTFDLLNCITKQCFESVENYATTTYLNPPKSTVRWYVSPNLSKKAISEERRTKQCDSICQKYSQTVTTKVSHNNRSQNVRV